MADLTERLRNAKYVMSHDGWQSSVLAVDAADRIEALERENAELLAAATRANETINVCLDDYREARRLALEEAAKVADEHALDFERQASQQKDGFTHDALLMASDACELTAGAIRAISERSGE